MTCQEVNIDKDEESSEENDLNIKSIGRPEESNQRSTTFDIQGRDRNVLNNTNGENLRTSALEMISAELLEIHQRYGHISFRRMVKMAKEGTINKKYTTCPIPTCSACLFAKAGRQQWRDKKRNNYKPIRNESPGVCVSVDQLVSPTPGLVAQMSGRLTTKRYKYATVFVDQATRLGYVYLQTSPDADKTLKAVRSFKEFAMSRGVLIKAYHADNGAFKANKWVDHCRANSQALTFAGVNAHHQNGLAERRIRELQDMTRSMLIHANHKWNKAITTNFWPYAMRMANGIMNETPNLLDQHRRSAEQAFSRTIVNHNTKHQKTFGCPTYVLDNKLQSGNIFHKWSERSRVGTYLGKSPQHSRNVSLVLDRNTGLVSPQFYVLHNIRFDTIKQENYDSMWQVKAGFVSVLTSKERTESNKSKESEIMATNQKRKRSVIEDNDIQLKEHRGDYVNIND